MGGRGAITSGLAWLWILASLTACLSERTEIYAPDCVRIMDAVTSAETPCVTVTAADPGLLFRELASISVLPACTARLGNEFWFKFDVTSTGGSGSCSALNVFYENIISGSGSCNSKKRCKVSGDPVTGCSTSCCSDAASCAVGVLSLTSSSGVVGWTLCNFTLVYVQDIDTAVLSNVAKNKPSTAISVKYSGDASRAVDGDKNTQYGGNSCMHTDDSEPDAWWRVDLGTEHVITRVMVTSRGDCLGHPDCSSACYCSPACAAWMSNFEIRVGNHDSADLKSNSLCAFRPGNMPCGVTETFSCTQPLTPGRFIYLQVGDPVPFQDSPRSLTFCELEAFGEPVSTI